MESKKAAFMGKITAGVTHEIKNVLAIIKESAGLMEDLILLCKEDAPPSKDRLLRTVTRITDQVARGVDLATKLNSFAHTPDDGTASVDLNQVVAQATFLSQRFARLKGMTLNVIAGESPCIVVTDPLALQMVLFQCVDLLMSLTSAGSIITVEPKGNGERKVIVTIAQESEAAKSAAPFPADLPQWKGIQTVAHDIALTVEAGGPPAWIAVGFSGAR